MSVVVIVADGARPDAIEQGIQAGRFPALARLRDEGFHGRVTTVFPSVTGLAYAPMLMGRHPATIGLPGLRWLDRARERTRAPHFTRSYLGWDLRHLNGDLSADAPTVFELASSSYGAMTMIGRGLQRRHWIGRSIPWQLRGAWVHFRGSLEGWLKVDRDVAELAIAHIARERPAYALVALLGCDKLSHAYGHADARVTTALELVDETVARIRADAERDGRWRTMQLWVVSDHGHSPVTAHDDLADVIREAGHVTAAHPQVRRTLSSDVAVMVSGNAMGHVYLDPSARLAAGWSHHAPRWDDMVNGLLARPSIDLALLPIGHGQCEVRRHEARAIVEVNTRGITYTPISGDPLGIGNEHLEAVGDDEAWERCATTDYPDALVQVARLAQGTRVGDIVVSAAPGWDFRAKHEPIPHVSSHGALHREHMWVPLLTNHPVQSNPRRTMDLFPSALAALGIATPAGQEGVDFLG